MRTTVASLFISLLSVSHVQAAWITVGEYCFDTAAICTPGAGTPVNIEDGGLPLTGTLTASGLTGPITGLDVRIRLIGLQHSWAGDLVVQLSKQLLGGIVTESVFHRINLTTPPDPDPDFGASSDFDTSVDVTGYYEFEVLGVLNLWTITQNPFPASGDIDVIPSAVSYAPSGPGEPTPLNWVSFNGIDPNGDWTISIQDLEAFEAGSIQGWSLQIFQTEVPEPATFGLALGALATVWFRRQRTQA